MIEGDGHMKEAEWAGKTLEGGEEECRRMCIAFVLFSLVWFGLV